MCRTRRRAAVCHFINSNADLIILIISRGTLQYNPFIFVEDFADPQIRELDVDDNANLVYIHITEERSRSRIEHATITRGSCGATKGATATGVVLRGAYRAGGGRSSGRGGGRGRRCLNRVSSSLVGARHELCNVSRRVRTPEADFSTKTPIQQSYYLRRQLCERQDFTQLYLVMLHRCFIIIVG